MSDDEPRGVRWPWARLSLFWRTFFLLALLLLGSILAWLQTLRSLEFEPRAVQTAQQLASQVNLSRAALIHADGIARISLIKTMKDQEGLRIVPREPTDQFSLLNNDALSRRVAVDLAERLGQGTVVANMVNEQPGLWVSFVIDGDEYWLQTDLNRVSFAASTTWMIWLFVAAVLSLAGAALIAGLINRPLKELSFAASRVREGNFSASQLDEHVNTSEIREVNIGFNRMAQKLAKVEQDRAVMLAGISHDLRTPLARLRLETEMSVADESARAYMVADINQLDAIIDKFLDYARPDRGVALNPVVLGDVVDACVYSLHKLPDVRIKVDMQEDLVVMADEVELGRVLTNLLENAKRYGKSVNTGIAMIDIAAIAREKWVLIKVRDHGLGVAEEQLQQLTQPFYRGEAARTAANGAGLGLAIVDKTIQRMGGVFRLTNSSSGGLSAQIRLQRATRL
ncbi:ATP-binding protein [uncultured Rhodoferax sp.]|uniref:ATP-binding protein n=1 Tax=uncultured Rhodoferax sp. TaxID=223188 RepID=UPI0025DE86A8|nr:ATP-binding protein [uncultured Rhodoferax sp.]